MLILVTGAAGKVGQALITRMSQSPIAPAVKFRALCHNRVLPETEIMSVMRGSIADREVCRAAIRDVTHVVHLATCKETPDDVMDVTVKGPFWLLEEFRVGLLVAGLSEDGARFRLRNDFLLADDTPVAQLTSLGGWLDLKSRKLTPPPPALAQALQALGRTEDFQVLPARGWPG